MLFPLIEEQPVFVRDVASRSGEVHVEVADGENNWDFERTVSTDKLAAFEVRGNLKEI